jgi:hypothetical protein
MAPNDSLPRQVLPIPDRKPVTLTTYDAKDPDTKFPPITPLRPPTGAVTYDYGRNGSTEFTGKVLWVEFDADIAGDDNNHLITPEERLSVAMAKQ